ncbi:MAG TPA: hypothetical protein PLR99_03925 [Polyangiaceae bacterium]|nr:hypothetical protein [Polyangiaceae bacterium]
MATLDLSSEFPAARDACVAEPSLSSAVRVGVHDASRVEWSVSLPLPEGRAGSFSIEVRLKVPENAYVEHAPWKHLQHFTRLDGPQLSLADDVQSIDELRRGVLALANKLARASELFARHCRLASSLFATAPHTELEGVLLASLEAAGRVVEDGRAHLATPVAGEPPEVARERRLVDEYISVRLLEMLAAAGRSLTTLGASRSPHVADFAPVIAITETHIGEALARELEHRQAERYVRAEPLLQKALERYLDRASQLKKHFQEVLFLEHETIHIVDRLSHVSAALVAVVASTWAFAWQLALLDRGTSLGARFGSGLTTVALLAGLIYATKDRMKELGRTFLAQKLNDVYDVQRFTRFRAPQRRLPGRDVVVAASECFKHREERLPDPLNPESGASVPYRVITYKSRGKVHPNAVLRASGVRRVKHVFRYDLSPLFGRLDDATKSVPVLCADSRKVRFIDAPKAYRLPFEVRVTHDDRGDGGLARSGRREQQWVESTVLVVHKRGLDRIERPDDDDGAAIGIEPG